MSRCCRSSAIRPPSTPTSASRSSPALTTGPSSTSPPDMSHPCLVTLDSRSAPRTLFSGDQLVEVDLPTGTRVVYPKPPLAALKDVDAAIRYAIHHPENSEPLYAKLRPGMKVTIAIDDISLPLPPMRRPDIRERVLPVVLDLLAAHGVDDVELIL